MVNRAGHWSATNLLWFPRRSEPRDGLVRVLQRASRVKHNVSELISIHYHTLGRRNQEIHLCKYFFLRPLPATDCIQARMHGLGWEPQSRPPLLGIGGLYFLFRFRDSFWIILRLAAFLRFIAFNYTNALLLCDFSSFSCFRLAFPCFSLLLRDFSCFSCFSLFLCSVLLFPCFSLLLRDFSCSLLFYCFYVPSCFLSPCGVLFPFLIAFAFHGPCCRCCLLVGFQVLSLCCFSVAFPAFYTFATFVVYRLLYWLLFSFSSFRCFCGLCTFFALHRVLLI